MFTPLSNPIPAAEDAMGVRVDIVIILEVRP